MITILYIMTLTYLKNKQLLLSMKGKIYIIKNSVDEQFYIGSTTTDIRVRFRNHKYRSKDLTRTSKLYTLMRQYGCDKFNIELLEEFECENTDELHIKEKEYILKYDSIKSLNHCVIKQTPKEYYNTHRQK